MITMEADATRVRVATRRDEDELMALCRRHHAESGVGDLNEDKVRSIMNRAFTPGRNDPGIIGVVGKSCIEGSICVVVEPMWYGDTPFLQEVWNFVAPEWRKATTNAKDLIAFAKRLAEPPPIGTGLKLWMGITSNHRTEAKMRLYRRQLGEPVGVTWLCGSTADADMRAN